MPSKGGNQSLYHDRTGHRRPQADKPHSPHRNRNRGREREQKRQQRQAQEDLDAQEQQRRQRGQEWAKKYSALEREEEEKDLKETIRMEIEDLQDKLARSEIYHLRPGEQMERLKDQIKKEITTLGVDKEVYRGIFNKIFDKNKWTKLERKTLAKSTKSFKHRPYLRELLQNNPNAERAAEGLKYVQSEMTRNGALAQELLDNMIALRQGQLHLVEWNRDVLVENLKKELRKLTIDELMARQEYLMLLFDYDSAVRIRNRSDPSRRQ